jgi:hypothetical protein
VPGPVQEVSLARDRARSGQFLRQITYLAFPALYRRRKHRQELFQPMAKQMSPLPAAKTVRANPSAAELKELAAAMPNARRTRYENLNVQTRVLDR